MRGSPDWGEMGNRLKSKLPFSLTLVHPHMHKPATKTYRTENKYQSWPAVWSRFIPCDYRFHSGRFGSCNYGVNHRLIGFGLLILTFASAFLNHTYKNHRQWLFKISTRKVSFYNNEKVRPSKSQMNGLMVFLSQVMAKPKFYENMDALRHGAFMHLRKINVALVYFCVLIGDPELSFGNSLSVCMRCHTTIK